MSVHSGLEWRLANAKVDNKRQHDRKRRTDSGKNEDGPEICGNSSHTSKYKGQTWGNKRYMMRRFRTKKDACTTTRDRDSFIH